MFVYAVISRLYQDQWNLYYQNSESTLTLHLCLRMMGWTCFATLSRIFRASSSFGFLLSVLISHILWRSPKFIAFNSKTLIGHRSCFNLKIKDINGFHETAYSKITFIEQWTATMLCIEFEPLSWMGYLDEYESGGWNFEVPVVAESLYSNWLSLVIYIYFFFLKKLVVPRYIKKTFQVISRN